MKWLQIVVAPLQADRAWLRANGFRQTKARPERFYRFIHGDKISDAKAEVRPLRLIGCGIYWRPVRRSRIHAASLDRGRR